MTAAPRPRKAGSRGKPVSKKPVSKKPATRKPARKQPAGPEAPKTWGSLARKGVRQLEGDARGAAGAPRDLGRPTEGRSDEWVDEGPVRKAAVDAARRGSAGRRPRSGPSPAERGAQRAAPESREEMPAKKPVKGLDDRLGEAARAYERERYVEARKLLAPIVERWPDHSAARELYGITLYRLGQWRKAVEQLEEFRVLTGSTEQHPVLADCYRALRRYGHVDELWEELRSVSPAADLVTEGRIVAAGSLADRGRLAEAIAMLSKGFRLGREPRIHHLRRAYALADLQERAGDVPAARALFTEIVAADPEFGDAAERLAAL